MKLIIAPVKPDSPKPDIINLQTGLLLFLERNIITVNADERPVFLDRLRQEQQQQSYADVTRRLVTYFQEQQHLHPAGEVDEPTAERLNTILRELGAFDTQPDARSERIVAGQVVQDEQTPFNGRVILFHESDGASIPLGEDATDPEGRYAIAYRLPADGGRRRIAAFDADGQRRAEATFEAVREVEVVNLAVKGEGRAYQVSGKVASDRRPGVDGLRVVIVDKNVGGDVTITETLTDAAGAYRAVFTYAGQKRKPDLQARAFNNQTFLGASEVRYNASNVETLHVLVAPAAEATLASEHETLTKDVGVHFAGMLRDLKETDERQDITYLANKTGWDARAVALAALADQFSARTADANGAPAIPQAFFYALFRAGMPANDAALYRTRSATVDAIWRQGIKQGIVPAHLENAIPAALERFQTLSTRQALDGPALVGVSSLKEMLSVSLGDDLDLARQTQFADLYTRHRGDPQQFWESVRGAFGEPTEKRLKLDGQLAYLTLNNAPLIRKLHAAGGQPGLTEALDLVEKGYYRADRWQAQIGNDPIPPGIPGEDDAKKRGRYAEVMAAQVRLSFPTAVVAQMVRSGETPLRNGLAGSVHTFLSQQQGKFDIGRQPVEQYVVRNNLQIDTKVVQEITRIQRVYQITPGDDAMNALLKKGLDSAYAVVRYDQDEFIRTFKDEMGGEENARLTYAKSQQVHNAVLNIATSYLVASTAPAIGVHSPAQIVDPSPQGPDPEAPNAADVIAYSSLEGLFGEMDYCECEHCRSILSPAAYLVNLLQFIDLRRFNSEGVELAKTYEKENPFDVLSQRRPDLQHLLLTCENTNTPLPYIDVVNETLEYFIVSKPATQSDPAKLPLSLDQYEGHNTDGDATPEELLATPQFVTDKAYEIVAGKPAQSGDPSPLLPPTPPLPFHQPLENLRRYFDKFEAPLPKVMEALRKDDSRERANPNDYGWRDILMEELRLSRAEYTLLTDRTLTLRQLYGYPPSTPEANVLAGLSNAKGFTRRVRISYEEIIEILKTRFVNPNSTLIPKLESLRIPFSTLKAFKDGTITDAEFEAALPSHLNASQYDGDIKAWVKNDENYANIMRLITLTNPTVSGDLCSFDKLEFRYANPDNNANKLRAFEFVRLIRFIRLWKKLGWTIEQTDKAITALYPTTQIPDSADDVVNLKRLDDGLLTLLPRLGVVKRVMDFLKLKPQKDLLPLLACFAPIDTHGATSLYRQMFLSPALLKQDEAFADDGYGNFLTDNNQKLTTHMDTLRAAFMLTDDELSQIIATLGYDPNTPLGHRPTLEELTQLLGHAPSDGEQKSLTDYYRAENISAVFRRGWMARKLRVSMREFLLLTQFTGLDPFDAPDPPNPPTQSFIELVDTLRVMSLKPTEALYLIWNQDISGKSAPDNDDILAFARTLRSDLAAIESEFAIADDPDGQIARGRMALVYRNDATDLFFAFLDNKVVTDVPYNHAQPSLEQAISNAASGYVSYDDLRKRLFYNAGVMPDTARDALKSVAGVTQSFKDAVEKLHKKTRTFFDRYPELLPLYDGYVVSKDPAEKKRSDLLASFLPQLKRRRKRQQALQAISAAEKTDIEFASALLDDAAVLHAARKSVLPATDVLADGQNGLSARFFFRDTASGTIDSVRAMESHLDYSPIGVHRLPTNTIPGAVISGIWSGYLKVPQDGPYLLSIEADAGSIVLLEIGGGPISLTRTGNTWSNNAPIELRAGIFYAVCLKAEKIRDRLKVEWDTLGGNLEVIPSQFLFPDNTAPALDDLTALEKTGLSAQFFFRDTATGVVDRTSDAEAHLDYSVAEKDKKKLPANGGNPISGIWSGYLEAPENGFYNFHIEADAAATVTLTLNGAEVPLAQSDNIRSNSAPTELRAGTLYALSLKVEKVKDILNARWETVGRGREIIPPRFVYGKTLTDHLRTGYVRFLKATSLARRLKLTAKEIVHFATHAEYRIGGEGWLNSLPVTGSPDKAMSSELLNAFAALLDFARVKAEFAPDNERLLAILKDPTAEQNADSVLLSLTRWNPASLDPLLLRFGKHVSGQPNQADRLSLKDLRMFLRVHHAYSVVRKLGIPATALINAATNEPNAATVRHFQAALRARYAESDWLEILKPINDQMRGLQRDALVAYILHQMRETPATAHIDTPDKLFEYFLMDVQMDPCMQTSRIRHALSSVQLFIERCLMNIESRVAPSSIKAKQWEWMKRYRIWEANRKVFLWPENWLEPELRDDQSPFFKETMNELLQSDITEDRAATALLNYLSKLEEVAKLEPCGIQYVENEPGTADDIAHVVARTAGANRKYFYRRREYGYWTPWEQIKLDIEDNPVIPVVWKGRLFLFWLRVIKQSPLKAQQPPTGELAKADASQVIKKDATNVRVQAVLCWSEYYNGKWQPTKTSDVNRPTTLTIYDPADPSAFDRSDMWLSIFAKDDILRVSIDGAGTSWFLLYNTHSLPLSREEAHTSFPLPIDAPSRYLHAASDTFMIFYSEGYNYSNPYFQNSLERPVLNYKIGGRTVEPRHVLQNMWDSPFFFQDSRHVFYVTTEERIVQVPEWNGYGVPANPPDGQLIIPPLVWEKIDIIPDLLGPIATGPHVGVVDPSPIKRFVSEDAYIKRGIAIKDTVRYGGKEFGLGGSLKNGMPEL